MLTAFLFSYPATWLYERLFCFIVMASDPGTIQYAIVQQTGQSLLVFSSLAVLIPRRRQGAPRRGKGA